MWTGAYWSAVIVSELIHVPITLGDLQIDDELSMTLARFLMGRTGDSSSPSEPMKSGVRLLRDLSLRRLSPTVWNEDATEAAMGGAVGARTGAGGTKVCLTMLDMSGFPLSEVEKSYIPFGLDFSAI